MKIMYSLQDCYKVPKDSDLRKFGIYCIENKVDSRQYVGSTTQSFFQRVQSHFRDLKKGKHHSKKFQGCFKNHTTDDYHIRILEILETKDIEVVKNREQYWLDELQPFYNVLKESYFYAGFTRSEHIKDKQIQQSRDRFKNQNIGATYDSQINSWTVNIGVKGGIDIGKLGRFESKEDKKLFIQRYRKSLRLPNNCTSGYRYINKASDRVKCWRVQYKHQRLGSFRTLEEAIKCRDEFLTKYNLF